MRILTLAVAAGALFVAGCGSSSNDSSSSTTDAAAAPATTTDAASAPAASSSGGAVTIHMKNFSFAPTTQTVKVGQKITWVNDDSVDHNVVGGPLKSKDFGQGGTYSYTPTKAGTISYVCTIHANMKATITVTS